MRVRITEAHKNYVEIMKNGKAVKVHKNLLKKAEADYDDNPPHKFPIISLDNINLDD